jgi:ribonuclease HI
MDAMPKDKFYVVWKGRKPGIFATWDECSAQVSGFAGAEYKAFPSRAAAEAAYRARYDDFKGKPFSSQAWLFAPSKPILPSLSVDAACSGSPGPVEYRGVETETGREIFRLGPYADGTNNIGEFLALVHALAWMQKNGQSMPIYSDSETALAWLRTKHCKTSLARTKKNEEIFTLIARAEAWLVEHDMRVKLLKWDTNAWGEIPADFGRK